ncbi:MAG: DUF502 domain-containing protein [Planctomycetaceae bacterium]|nr:DUF502 domain-containing protein [Planctomycetaceae bacterium]
MIQPAKRFIGFFKATVIGGVFILAPLVLLIYLISQAVLFLHRLMVPLLDYLPDRTVGGASMLLGAAIAAVVLICFVAGLIAHTTLARWLVQTIEAAVLANIPGYTLIKSMGEGLVGMESETTRKAVLVHFDDHSQVGFLMDIAADGRHVIFVPDVPSPWSGSLAIVAPERVEYLATPLREVIERLQRMGLGMGPKLVRLPESAGETPKN